MAAVGAAAKGAVPQVGDTNLVWPKQQQRNYASGNVRRVSEGRKVDMVGGA